MEHLGEAALIGVLILMIAMIPLGMSLGIIAAQVVVVRRGRMSLRLISAVVLIAALEMSLIARNTFAAPVFVTFFALVALMTALVDTALFAWFDGWRTTRLPSGRRCLLRAASLLGLAAIGLGFALFCEGQRPQDSEGISWLTGVVGFLILLAPITLIDAMVWGISCGKRLSGKPSRSGGSAVRRFERMTAKCDGFPGCLIKYPNRVAADLIPKMRKKVVMTTFDLARI